MKNQEINYLICLGTELNKDNINDYLWFPIFNKENEISSRTSEILKIHTDKKWTNDDLYNLIKEFNIKTRKINKWILIKDDIENKEGKKVKIFMKINIF